MEKKKNKVESYLVDRIRQLESENQELKTIVEKETKDAIKYRKLKKCFYVEDNAIFVIDLSGAYVGCFMAGSPYGNDNEYKEALELLELKEEDFK